MWALLKRWDFWFGLLGALGLVFAIYTYVVTNKIGQISYTLDTQKVFDPANLSGFTLVNPDKNPVQQPVYATEAVIWNSGNLSLSDNSDRVREPLITLNGIIYYHIVSKINLVDKSNYRLESSPDGSNITISWKYFDPGQGIRLTLLHSDNGDPKITLAGRFFEASLREEQQSRLMAKTRAEFDTLWVVGAFFLVLGLAIFLARRLSLGPFRVPELRFRARLFTLMGTVTILEGLTLLALYGYIHYFSTVPPV